MQRESSVVAINNRILRFLFNFRIHYLLLQIRCNLFLFNYNFGSSVLLRLISFSISYRYELLSIKLSEFIIQIVNSFSNWNIYIQQITSSISNTTIYIFKYTSEFIDEVDYNKRRRNNILIPAVKWHCQWILVFIGINQHVYLLNFKFNNLNICFIFWVFSFVSINSRSLRKLVKLSVNIGWSFRTFF